MSLRQKVSSAIRILRWNRDVSARASHLVVKKDPLITYESVILGQAGSRNVLDSTFSERKIMSTKTSFKRIAAVAAVALTLGGLSAVSASANTQADTLAISATASSTTIGTPVHIFTTQTFLAPDAEAADTLSLAAYMISAPAYNTAMPVFTTGTASAAVGTYTDLYETSTVGSPTSTLTVTNSAASKYVVANNTLTLTPLVPGTYVIKLLQTNGATSTAQAAPVTWTVTVADTNPISANFSKSFMMATAAGDIVNTGISQNTAYNQMMWATTWSGSPITQNVFWGGTATDSALTAAANDVGAIGTFPVAAASAGSAVFAIGVLEANNSVANNNASAKPITATISGHGYVGIGGQQILGTSITESSATSGSDGYTFGTKFVTVHSDGTAGSATVTISVGTTVLTTRTIIFYSSATTAKATNNSSIVRIDGADAGNGAAEIFFSDANGNGVMGLVGSIIATSSNTAVLQSRTAANSSADCYDDSNPALLGAGLPGYYACDVLSVAGAASGSTATITYTVKNAAGTVIATSNPVTYTTGDSTIGSIALSLDNTNYAPGDKATLTLTAKDKYGNPVADGKYYVFNSGSTAATAYAGMSASAPVTSSLFAATAYVPAVITPAAAAAVNAGGVTFANGVATKTFYAPYTTGTLVISGTTSGSSASLSTGLKNLGLGTSLTVSAAVTAPTDVAAQAAIDAAQEATDAANAAYDAANNAMDSADAATAAAQDASDNASAALAAVTSLSATVAKLVSSVTAIATALAAIKKKLGVK